MLRIRVVIALVVASVPVAPAWSQPDAGEPTPAVATRVRPLHPPHQFDRLGRNEGLPQDQVTSVVQDTQGFMWFGTQSGGVARFDGYDIRTFAALTGEPLPTQFVTSLAIGPQGKLWIGTGEAGVIVYDPETNSSVQYAPGSGEHGLATDVVLAMFKDADGRLWLGGADRVIYRWSPGEGKFIRYELARDVETDVRAIGAGPESTLWVGTGAAGAYLFDPEKGEVIEHHFAGDSRLALASNDVRAVLIDRNETLWLGTSKGLHRLDAGGNRFTVYENDPRDRTSLADDRITSLFEDREGILWIGTESGLGAFDRERRVLTRYAPDPAYPIVTNSYPHDVASIFQGNDGVLWFATGVGLRKLDALRMKIDTFINAAGQGDPTSFLDGEPGVLWVGTYKTGLLRVDRNEQQVTVFTHLGDPRDPGAVKLNEWISDMYRDPAGVMWIVGQGLGLIMWNPRTGEYKQHLANPESLEGPTANHIESIAVDRAGYLWLATWGEGLNRFDPETEEFIDFVADEDPSSHALSSSYLHVLAIDRKDPNTLWIGTARGGLDKFDLESQQSARYSLAPEGAGKNAPQDTILCIHQSDDGVLWLGTDGGGLIRFDPATRDKQYITEAQGLAHNTVYGILADDQGRLWMSTNGGGISVYDPRAAQAQAQAGESGKSPSTAFLTFTAADGLVSNEFAQNGYFRGQSGQMYFAGIGGFNAFDPVLLEPDAYAPPIAITSFQIFNREAALPRPIWTRPSIGLAYTDSVFSFEFAALAFGAPEKLRYAYKMDGLHDWIETNRRFVTYTNVDGGDYVFRVRAQNRHGVWGEDAIALPIAVASPPWKTWWAYSLYTLFAIGVAFGYLRYQSRKVDALQQAHRLETVERELELTGAVQTGFLPSANAVESARFRLYGFYRPADRASGDWWWWEEAASTLSILVGDVTGHGPGPAMVTAAAATAFRIQGRSHGITMADRLTQLNEEVLRVGGGNYQMTMSAVELDATTGRFVFHSAGGLPIMRLRDDGRPRLLPCPGTPLGTKAFVLGRVEGTLMPGERMLLYTDGIPEIPLRNGRLLGMRRFSMICENTRGLSLRDAAQQIVMSADMLRQDQPQDDDWTFALVEWTGSV